jgi:sugar phosphate isomerase/epimerase
MLPFDETTNWDRIIKTLNGIKYNGVLSLEVQQERHEKYYGLSPENYLELAFERAERIEKGLKGIEG